MCASTIALSSALNYTATVDIEPKAPVATPGSTIVFNVTVTTEKTAYVNLNVAVPENWTLTINPDNGKADTQFKSTLTVTVPTETPPGFYNVTVRAVGGDLSQSETVTIQVLASTATTTLNPASQAVTTVQAAPMALYGLLLINVIVVVVTYLVGGLIRRYRGQTRPQRVGGTVASSAYEIIRSIVHIAFLAIVAVLATVLEAYFLNAVGDLCSGQSFCPTELQASWLRTPWQFLQPMITNGYSWILAWSQSLVLFITKLNPRLGRFLEQYTPTYEHIRAFGNLLMGYYMWLFERYGLVGGFIIFFIIVIVALVLLSAIRSLLMARRARWQ
jgi:hypothetical protein